LTEAFIDSFNPPPLPPGPELLTSNDQSLNNDFFNLFTTNNFPHFDFNYNVEMGNLDGFGALPPDLVATTSSFGQQPSFLEDDTTRLQHPPYVDSAVAHTADMMPPPPSRHLSAAPTHPEQAHAADILAGATALVQHHNLPSIETGVAAPPSIQHKGQATPGSPHSLVHHQHMVDFRFGDQTSVLKVATDHDDTFLNMMNGTARTSSIPRSNPEDVRWGTDQNFSQPRGYVPASERETREALETERVKYMGCLQPSHGIDTRSPTPGYAMDVNYGKAASPRRLKTSTASSDGDLDCLAPTNPIRGGRKSHANGGIKEVRDESAVSRPSKPPRKRKSVVSLSKDSNGSGKRRKSSASGAAKQPRENLSEEQKRQNHIQSEQKRRVIIGKGYEQLIDMVPDLRNHNLSRSGSLTVAAEWLEKLLQGNESLREQGHQIGLE